MTTKVVDFLWSLIDLLLQVTTSHLSHISHGFRFPIMHVGSKRASPAAFKGRGPHTEVGGASEQEEVTILNRIRSKRGQKVGDKQDFYFENGGLQLLLHGCASSDGSS